MGSSSEGGSGGSLAAAPPQAPQHDEMRAAQGAGRTASISLNLSGTTMFSTPLQSAPFQQYATGQPLNAFTMPTATQLAQASTPLALHMPASQQPAQPREDAPDKVLLAPHANGLVSVGMQQQQPGVSGAQHGMVALMPMEEMITWHTVGGGGGAAATMQQMLSVAPLQGFSTHGGAPLVTCVTLPSVIHAQQPQLMQLQAAPGVQHQIHMLAGVQPCFVPFIQMPGQTTGFALQMSAAAGGAMHDAVSQQDRRPTRNQGATGVHSRDSQEQVADAQQHGSKRRRVPRSSTPSHTEHSSDSTAQDAGYAREEDEDDEPASHYRHAPRQRGSSQQGGRQQDILGSGHGRRDFAAASGSKRQAGPTAPPRAQIRSKSSAFGVQFPRTRPNVSDLVEHGLLVPGRYTYTVGNTIDVDVEVTTGGMLQYSGGAFNSISSFALTVLKQRNPDRQACDGWKEVKYKGVKMETLRLRCLELMVANESGTQRSSHRPGK